MHRTLILTAASLMALAGAAAQAADTSPSTWQEQHVDKREQRQADRIDQGVASGELNGREQLRLQRQQNHIQKIETRAEADGTVTRKEAVHLEHAQDQASRSIWRQKHDRQVRP